MLVAVAPDLAVVEVRLGGVLRHDRDAVQVQLGMPRTEHLLEVHVPDVSGVVVPRHDDQLLALDPVHELARDLVLAAEAVRRRRR